MTLVVVLHRQTKEQANYGTLRAYASQGGKYGANLLAGRQITDPDRARREVENLFAVRYPGVQIEWRDA